MGKHRNVAKDQNILNVLEKSSVKSSREKLKKYRAAAISDLRKNKRINIRIPETDLLKIQFIAMEEGMPYQTLIASVLHKFSTGKFNTYNT